MQIINRINASSFITPDCAKLLLRLAVGVLVLFHGYFKLTHPEAMGFVAGQFTEAHLPGFLAYLIYIGEIIAPIMLIIGYETKVAALLVAITLFVAILLVHLPQLFTVSPMGGGYALELQFMFLSGALAIFGLGAGKYQLLKK